MANRKGTMMNETPDDMNDLGELRDRLQAIEPPAALEASVLRAVRLDRRRDALTRSAITAIAAIALLGIGWLLRGAVDVSPTQATAHEGRYVLLLYPGADDAPLSGDQTASRVREYGEWARGARSEGEILSGEKLADARELINGTEVRAPLEGYFVVRAASMERAVEIAKTCPHARYGGRIEVRLIE